MNKITLELSKFNQNSTKLLELQLKKYFKDLTYNEVRAIECIGQSKEINLTKLANKINISRGGATKLTKRLIELDLIQKYTNASNKKEVYFKTTTKGEQINQNHIALHKSWDTMEDEMFKDISEEIQNIVFDFLIKANQISEQEIIKLEGEK